MQLLDIDTATLPAALVTLFKQHSRIEHDRDDALCTAYLGMSIQMIEQRANISIFSAEWSSPAVAAGWWPRTFFRSGRWMRLPLNNVSAMAYVPDSGAPVAVEVTASPFITNASSYARTDGVPINGPGHFTFNVGTDDEAKLSPAILAAVLRIAASYYENREAPLALSADSFAPELAAIWRPSA